MPNLRKLKAVLGTGVTGGALGFLLGVVMAAVGAFISPGDVTLLGASILTGSTTAFGLISAGGFAALLSKTKGAESLEDVSTPRSTLLGFAAGGVLPLFFCAGAVAFGYSVTPSDVAALVSFFGVLGGGMAAGIVSVAKASSKELPSRTSVRLLP